MSKNFTTGRGQGRPWVHALVLCAGVALHLACAAKPPTPTAIDAAGLIPITDTRLPDVRAYQAPDLDRSKYHGIYVEPATLYAGADAQFGDTSVDDRLRIAAEMTEEMKRALAKDFNVVSTPGPGVVRLQMTLVGIDEGNPVLATGLRVTPVGIVLAAERAATHRPAAFSGSIEMAAVTSDADTGQVLGAMQAVVSPAALDLSSGLARLRAADLSVKRAADAFRDYLVRSRQSESVPGEVTASKRVDQ